MELLLIIIAMFILGAFATTASELGVDSRDLSDDPHRSDVPGQHRLKPRQPRASTLPPSGARNAGPRSSGGQRR